MKNNFSAKANQRLLQHTQNLFYEEQKDKLFFSTHSGVYNSCHILVWILFFVNIFFYMAMFLGTLIQLVSYDRPVEVLFSGFTVSLILLVGGLIVYKIGKRTIGSACMLVSTVIKYFAVYSNKSPFDFSITRYGTSNLGTPKAQFFMHFLPMLALFLVCLYIMVTELYEKRCLSLRFQEVCRLVYNLKSDDEFGFTSDQEWDQCVEKYLSGDYKNFKKPKKSLRKRYQKQGKLK